MINFSLRENDKIYSTKFDLEQLYLLKVTFN